MTLDTLPVGGSAVVSHLTGDPIDRQRLGEMGLTSGTPVRVVRVAPLGDPLELRVRGYNLSVRRKDAATISISS